MYLLFSAVSDALFAVKESATCPFLLFKLENQKEQELAPLSDKLEDIFENLPLAGCICCVYTQYNQDFFQTDCAVAISVSGRANDSMSQGFHCLNNLTY